MADGLFCIDFGSAYTKVSIRRGRRTNAEMLSDPEHTTDELNICVPSAVVIDATGTPPRYTFGLPTESRRSGGSITVRRNWKKELFFPPHEEASAPAPTPRPATRLERLVHSDAFRLLAEQHRVTQAELHSLQRLVIHATSLTLPIFPAGQPPSAADPHLRIAGEYFTWLRSVVLNACASLTPAVEKPEDYPVRVTVPGFAPESELAKHPGCIRLAAALRHAKWSLHPDRPFISEPYANSIGALTQGSNCTRVADMFRRGLLITALASPGAHPEYRVVVIDVGAFTTDFAALTLRTGGRTITLDELEFESKTVSVPLGMSDLDEQVLHALTPENQKYMREEAPTADWRRFRRDVYLLSRPFNSPVGQIGGPPERPQIDQQFRSFCQRLETEAECFFGPLGDVPFKEVVLTGGGCTFPWIQETLIVAAERGRSPFRKVHLPAVPPNVRQRTSGPTQVVAPLEGPIPRGATALGGASAFFEMVA